MGGRREYWVGLLRGGEGVQKTWPFRRVVSYLVSVPRFLIVDKNYSDRQGYMIKTSEANSQGVKMLVKEGENKVKTVVSNNSNTCLVDTRMLKLKKLKLCSFQS